MKQETLPPLSGKIPNWEIEFLQQCSWTLRIEKGGYS